MMNDDDILETDGGFDEDEEADGDTEGDDADDAPMIPEEDEDMP